MKTKNIIVILMAIMGLIVIISAYAKLEGTTDEKLDKINKSNMINFGILFLIIGGLFSIKDIK